MRLPYLVKLGKRKRGIAYASVIFIKISFIDQTKRKMREKIDYCL